MRGRGSVSEMVGITGGVFDIVGLVSVQPEGAGGCNISLVIPTVQFSRTEN